MQDAPMGKKKKPKARGRKRHRRYSVEFKDNAVRLATRGDKPVVAVAKELGVPAGTLHEWIQRFELDKGLPAPEGETAEQKVARLEKRVALLEEERTILKKAATFFAKESE